MPARRCALLLAALAVTLGCRRGDLASADPESRAAAVRRVGTTGGEPILLVAQRDPSPTVRRAAAEALAARRGRSAASALGALVADPDPEVARAAARGLAAMPDEPGARADLLAAYAGASSAGRLAVADALDALGISLREAVELEARTLWERNVAALAGDDLAARAGGAEELGASARAEAVQRLLPFVDPNRNPDRALAAAAARGLGQAGDFAARPFLEALLEEGDASVAEAAAEALAQLGDPAASNVLAVTAAAGSARVAAAAADALAALPGAPEVAIALCGVAVRTLDPAVAARTARSVRERDAECPDRPFLARLGGPGAEAALAALGELGLSGAAAQAASERAVALLDPARAGPAVRAAAARLLARLGLASSAPALARRASMVAGRLAEGRARSIPGRPGDVPGFEGEATELAALLSAVGRLHADGAEALLLGAAQDPLAQLRAGAIEGLAHLGTPAALEAVVRGLGDPDLGARIVAAGALGRQGGRGAAPLAAAAAEAREPEWRIALARALGHTGSAEAIPALAALLEGSSAPAAASALARLGAPAAAAPLVAYLESPDATARAEAIGALAYVGAREAAPAIALQLTHDRPEVRAEAARAIGRLRSEAAPGRLEALRSDYDGRVRRAAVEALSKLPSGGPRPRP
jgi:HEAT repeat protein